ncbi:MAG: RluA family pseudouridine synthase [Streptococcaceae bacterium]|jgi:23S rRNA pseudouridine1911/1915/1917 synthase|nr:RluA family pseudouridine synthase [Streptococcaceae bacterium]
MEFSFVNDIRADMLVKRVLKHFGVSKNLLARVKFDGGEIFVAGIPALATTPVALGEKLTIFVPDEKASETLVAENAALDVIYEDADYLIVNKPAGSPSITGREKPTGSMSNFVAGYIRAKNYPNQTVHIVTRLDKDTSGLMLFAKHRYAHALLSAGRGRESLQKRYFALIKANENFVSADRINLPIGRAENSIIKRQVRFDGFGGLYETKNASTSYTTVLEKNDLRLLDLTLHTGRTHQIRVHMSHIGFPLIGDTLYGGNHDLLARQALHCHHLEFKNLIRNQKIVLECPLPDDLQKLLK